MFGWEFPPHNSGGLGVACYGLTKALAGKGAKILFVLPKKVGVGSDVIKIIFADEASGIKFKEIDSILSPYITSREYERLRRNYISDIYGKGLFEEVARYALRAREIAEKEKFDIIHAHDWLSFGAGTEAKKVSGKPLVVHVHATEFDRTGGNSINQHVYEIEKEGMEKADAVITVSQFTKNMVVKHYGINPEKIRVVYNAIDAPQEPEFNSTSEQTLRRLKEEGYKIVLFVGRITLQKGPDYFVKVAKKVLEHNPKVVFIIAGSGDMERQVLEETARAGISDKFFFTGFLRGEELDRVYRTADLYILPSVSEPFGITPLESLMNGAPVLMSKQSGVSEIINHALKTDFWDIDEMANKTLAVLNYPALHSCLKEYGQGEVKKLSWQAPAEKCLEIYDSLLNRPAFALN